MIYDYRCKEHGKFSADVPVEKRLKAKCPKCKRNCQKIISFTPLIFRDDGFTKHSQERNRNEN